MPAVVQPQPEPKTNNKKKKGTDEGGEEVVSKKVKTNTEEEITASVSELPLVRGKSNTPSPKKKTKLLNSNDIPPPPTKGKRGCPSKK